MYRTLAFFVFNFPDHFRKKSLNLQLENSKFFQQCEISHRKIFPLILNDNANLLSMLSRMGRLGNVGALQLVMSQGINLSYYLPNMKEILCFIIF
jgi:hypothetical protein